MSVLRALTSRVTAVRSLIGKGRRVATTDVSQVPSGAVLIIVCFGLVLTLIVAVSLRVITGYSPSIFGLTLNPAHKSSDARQTTALAVPATRVPTSAPPSAAPTVGNPYYGSRPSASKPAPSKPAGHTTPAWIVNPPPPTVVLAGPTVSNPTSSSAPPTSSSTPTTPPATSSPSAPPVPNDAAANTPSGTVSVQSVEFSAAAGGGTTVTITGLHPRQATTSAASAYLDWGDGSARDTQPSATTADGVSYTHTYAAAGSYTITWGDASGSSFSWSHQLDLATAGSFPGPLTLNQTEDTQTANLEHFDESGPNVTWARWVLDYGDGYAAVGQDHAGFDDASTQHQYDGTGHTATLTVFAPDGQLATATVATS